MIKKLDQEFRDDLSRIPTRWTCCKCRKTFDYSPMSNQLPEGFEKVPTYPEGPHGRVIYKPGGGICERCM